MVIPNYETIGDSVRGPLSYGDVGTILDLESGTRIVKVQSEDGRIWDYPRKALQVIHEVCQPFLKCLDFFISLMLIFSLQRMRMTMFSEEQQGFHLLRTIVHSVLFKLQQKLRSVVSNAGRVQFVWQNFHQIVEHLEMKKAFHISLKTL